MKTLYDEWIEEQLQLVGLDAAAQSPHRDALKFSTGEQQGSGVVRCPPPDATLKDLLLHHHDDAQPEVVGVPPSDHDVVGT